MDIKKADGNHPVCDLNKPALNKYLISRNLSVINPMLSRNYLLRVTGLNTRRENSITNL